MYLEDTSVEYACQQKAKNRCRPHPNNAARFYGLTSRFHFSSSARLTPALPLTMQTNCSHLMVWRPRIRKPARLRRLVRPAPGGRRRIAGRHPMQNPAKQPAAANRDDDYIRFDSYFGDLVGGRGAPSWAINSFAVGDVVTGTTIVTSTSSCLPA